MRERQDTQPDKGQEALKARELGTELDEKDKKRDKGRSRDDDFSL